MTKTRKLPLAITVFLLAAMIFSSFGTLAVSATESSENPTSTNASSGASETENIDYTTEQIVIPDGVEFIEPSAYKNYKALKKVTLPSSIKEIGEDAFRGCTSLTSVTGLENVEKIGDYAFADCTNFSNATLSSSKYIGNYAFYNTAVTNLTLWKVVSIGDSAFENCASLVNVKIPDSNKYKIESIGDRAFAYCESLTKFEGLQYIKRIGELAFAYTALTSVDLGAAEYIGSYAFVKSEPTDFSLTLASSIKELGENPFTYCNIAPISKPGDASVFTFDLGECVKIIDGSVYAVVDGGLELVSYFGSAKNVTVANGTVRISANAFRAAQNLEKVTLPYSLKAIGHKAFFECTNLKRVTFGSYNAPTLEVAADFEDDATAARSANFKNYADLIESKIDFIIPVNGRNYDTPDYAQYFDLLVHSNAVTPVADETTAEAITAISKIPATVTLDDKATVEAAREAYNKVTDSEQKSLLAEYIGILEKAEAKIKELETPDEPIIPDTPPVTEDKPAIVPEVKNEEPTEEEGGLSIVAVIIIIIIVLSVGTVAISSVVISVHRKNIYRR